MKITKEILESTVKDIAKVVLPAVVDEDFNIDEKAPYELYNAIVGTVFDEAGYNKVVNDSPEFLYYHIPGGSKMTSDKKSLDITGDDKVDAEDVEAIDEILNKENITKEDIEKGDVSGDFKVDTHDKKLVEKEAERQKKSTIDVDTDSVYTEEEAVTYNAQLEGAVKAGDYTEDVEVESDAYDYVYDEDSWDESYANGGLKKYYVSSDAASPYKEDLWNEVEQRAANWNDIVKDGDEPVEFEDGYHYEDSEGNPCIRCWEGAINAPGAKYPWIVVNFEEDVNATIKFQYEGKEDVTPWDDTVFGKGNEHKEWGCASIPTELGNEFLLTDGETTFDINKFKMILVKQDVEQYTTETAAAYNATLPGAVKAGDKK